MGLVGVVMNVFSDRTARKLFCRDRRWNGKER